MKSFYKVFYLCMTIQLVLGYALVAQTNKTVIPKDRILKLMTYNLKFASPSYVPSWEVRRDMQIDMIRKYTPDIIGTQEGLKEQIDYLADHLPEYVVVGEGRKGGDDDLTNPDLLKNSFENVNKIDWILYKGSVKVLKCEEVNFNVNGIYPSDHKPVYVEVEIPGK